MNLEWYIAHRLLKGDGTKSVSVPIVKIAIVGIALGLSVMLLSLFIITGFKYEITDKLSGFTAHLSVVPFVPGSTSEGGGSPRIGGAGERFERGGRSEERVRVY